MTKRLVPSEVWGAYAESWKLETREAKLEQFETCLSKECVYTDPVTQARGWSELSTYMLEFHKQIPGGHFLTTDFMAHHDRCLAKWEMRTGTGELAGVGTSYGEYDESGLLKSMTGFFLTP